MFESVQRQLVLLFALAVAAACWIAIGALRKGKMRSLLGKDTERSIEPVRFWVWLLASTILPIGLLTWVVFGN